MRRTQRNYCSIQQLKRGLYVVTCYPRLWSALAWSREEARSQARLWNRLHEELQRTTRSAIHYGTKGV